jgi:hypothetical protein
VGTPENATFGHRFIVWPYVAVMAVLILPYYGVYGNNMA